VVVPCLMLRRGEVCLPGPEGPVRARRRSGAPYDVFDVLDQLSPNYPWLYLVDLDGIERNDPQLEYIQELSRDMPLWVDSGVRTADQAIDVLVAGALKAVLSSAHLRGPRELRRSWRLSTELIFELEWVEYKLAPIDPDWNTSDVMTVANAVREVGVTTLVLSSHGTEPDWSLVTRLSPGGPTWVAGAFTVGDRSRLAPAGAAGGIFHINEILAAMDAPDESTPVAGAGGSDAR
jgi:uncharacterized protein related to proFAR isomerase